jgi:hypothetical protein
MFNAPYLLDGRSKSNDNKIKSFNDLKPKWKELCSYFRYYPDKFIDFIKPADCKIELYFYQRIYLRIMMRYRKVFITATRGTSKSFLENLSFVLRCIMFPGTKLFICAPKKEQSAKISQDCLNDIFSFYPILRSEVKHYTESKDYTRLVFHNGSRYDVVQIQDSTRGGRRNGGAIEEIADRKFNGDMLNSVIIPLMANDRIAMCGGVDPNELHKSQLYVTTAGTQQQFAFEKMKETYTDMLQGKSAFNIGNGWELPCMHGQLDEDFVNDLKESPTFSLPDWMREYDSVWTGSSSDNLVSEEKLNKCRTVTTPEWEHCGQEDVEYALAYDVSRAEGIENALSCLVVIKMIPRGDGTFMKNIVNVFSHVGEHSQLQAKFLKEQVKAFKASILILDSNGLGVAVTDSLVLDLDDGNPPYSVVNDPDYEKYELPNSIPMVFALKAQNKETRQSDMINHFMQVFNKMDVGLLVNPNDGVRHAEKALKRKFKDDEEQVLYELPFIMTNSLCEEIMNLRYKQTGNDTKVETISKRIPKDKFSALMYGLYWVYLQEKDNQVSQTPIQDITDYLLVSNPFRNRKR